MPFKSKAQQRYFYANRKKLQEQGVDADEWSAATDYQELPEHAEKKAGFNWTAEEHAGSRDPTDVLWSLPQPRVFIKNSGIHGRGTFCTWTTKKNRIVSLALVISQGKAWRTIASRFLNHSEKPNIRLEFRGPFAFMVANRRINPGQELTLDYRTLGSLAETRSTRERDMQSPDFQKQASAGVLRALSRLFSGGPGVSGVSKVRRLLNSLVADSAVVGSGVAAYNLTPRREVQEQK